MEVVGKLRWAAALVLCVGSPVAGQSSGLDRPHDPVVLDGSRAAQLHGVNVGRLVAFRWQTGWVQVPLQVDERFEVPYQTVFQGYNVNTSLTLLSYADANTYTGADPDAAFDADDELAFMASGAGERAPLLAPPPAGTLGTGLELLLTDPLDGAVGYVYVYESDGSLLPSAGQDAVSYQFNLLAGPYIPNYATWGGGNPEDSVIATPAYRVHFSERWVRDELALFAGGASGVDVLDRHRFSQAPTVCNRTEDSFSDGVGAFFANIDGPVRAIRSYMGANSGPLTQRVHRFYAQREDVAMIYRVHAIGRAGLDLFDYRPDAAGMSYSNSLNPVPVPIDGVPEPMALGDLEWELVDGPHGSLIHAHRVATDFPTTLTSYYSDHVTPPTPPCSGDASDYAASGSYGVSPLQNTDPRNTPTYNYVRERTIYYGAPGQDVATATLRAAQANAPLSVGVRDHVAAGDVARYCTASSTTCGSPSIGATGVPLASASSGFVIAASNVRAGKPAILLYSNAGAASIPWTYGTLCVNHPRRAPTMVAVGTPNQCDGVVSLDMNGFAAGVLGGDPKAYLTVPGTLVNCQWWGRTSAQEEPFLSDALSYVVQAEPAPIDAVLSTVVVLPSQNVTANGIDDATVLVTLRDTYGNPVAGESVRIDASGANNTILQPIGPTDANGVTTGNVSSWTAETKTVTVTLVSGNTPVLLNAAPTVRFVGDPATIDLALSSATATPASVLANGVATATVSVTVRDANNNVVPRQQVLISASGGNNTLNQPLGPTDADGVATALVASTLAQTKTITAVVNPQSSPVILAQQPTVVFSRDPSTINGALSSAVATPTAGLVANGVVKATLTVTVRDAFGNPVPGQVVQLAATGSGNTLLQPTEPTDANGQATGTLASYIAGQKQITVTVNPQGSAVVLDDEPVVAFVGDPATIQPGLSSAVAVPAAGVLANGVAQSTVTVTVRDANGNVVAGQNVQLAATGAGNSIVQPGSTNASGVASGTIASTAAGTKTLTVTINPQGAPVVLSTQPTVAFVADPGTLSASLSSAVAVPASNIPANGSATSTLTVTVRDAFGNPVAGQMVQLAATGTGNTLVQPAGPTNASGVASGTLASTQAETKTLTATVNPQGAAVVLNEHPTVAFASIGPVVTSVVPAFGTAQGNTLVTVHGAGFQSGNPGTNAVTFGGVAATNVSVIDDQRLSCRTPAGAQGAQVNVVVSNNNGSSTLVAGYRYNDTPAVGPIAEQFGDVDALYAFQVAASDPDPGESLTFTSVGTPLPPWAVLTPSTGLISGTPGAAQHGTTSGHVIAVSDGFNPPVASNAFAFTVASTPAVLAFGVPPSPTVVCGVPWSAFSVRVEDAYGNRVGTATHLIKVTRKAGTGTLSGNLARNAVAGIATFSGLSYDLAEAITIDVMANAMAGLLGVPIHVTSGPAAQLGWHVAPTTTAQVGTVFSYFAVEVRDTCGNRVTSDNSTQIQLTVQSGLGALSGTLTRTVQAGLAVFEDVAYDRIETVVFQVTSLPSSTVLSSPVVDVRASPAVQALGRASVTSGGAQSNEASTAPALSGDGRYVAFESVASNLVPGDTNAKRDVFLRDRSAGTTVRVSVDSAGTQANSDSFSPSLSDDGRFVAFHSAATNLVQSDTNGTTDVFVHDRVSGATKRVSLTTAGVQGNGASSAPALSAAGRYVAFESVATNLVGADTNAKRDIFLRDQLTGTTTRVSVDSAGVEANGDSQMADISGDGSCVAFASSASNLAPSDTNAQMDVFVRVLASAQTTRVSISTAGVQANGASQRPSLSFDGNVVAFESLGTSLVSGDTNGASDVFVRLRSSGQTSRVSLSSASAQSNGASTEPAISADGLSITFRSTGTNLVCSDTATADLFVHRRATGATANVTRGGDSDSSLGALSANGRAIALASLASNLVVGDSNSKQDVFVAGALTLDTRISSGADDAEDRASSTNLTSDDLELGNGDSNDAEGLRFIGIPIPCGATIHEAWIEFQVDEVSSGSALLLVEGHDVDDAPVFSSANGDITNRVRTSAKVVWNVPTWATKSEKKLTPDLSAILQEIVSRPGWASCNDLVIIVTGTGSRVAESFEGTISGAPLLHVAYTP